MCIIIIILSILAAMVQQGQGRYVGDYPLLKCALKYVKGQAKVATTTHLVFCCKVQLALYIIIVHLMYMPWFALRCILNFTI